MPREQFDIGGSEIRVLVDEPVWAPTSVLGNVVTMRHQYEAWETVRDWGYWEQAKRADSPVDKRLEPDYRLVVAVAAGLQRFGERSAEQFRWQDGRRERRRPPRRVRRCGSLEHLVDAQLELVEARLGVAPCGAASDPVVDGLDDR